MLIDLYCHIYPERYLQKMTQVSPRLGNIGKRLRSVERLHNLDARFREMDQFGDYRQVVSLPNPPIEEIADSRTGAELARIANDEMAELCRRHPDRFLAFAAALSLTDVASAVEEAHRAITSPASRAWRRRRPSRRRCRPCVAGTSARAPRRPPENPKRKSPAIARRAEVDHHAARQSHWLGGDAWKPGACVENLTL